MLLGREQCHLRWQSLRLGIFSRSAPPKPLRKEITQTYDGHARDPITASALEVGAPAGSSRHQRSRGIGIEL